MIKMYKYKDFFYCNVGLSIEQKFQLKAMSLVLQSASKEQLIELLLENTEALLITQNRAEKMMADIVKNQF